MTAALKDALVQHGTNLYSVFSAFDTNGDGMLSAAEFRKGFQGLTGMGLSEELLEQLMAVLDTDFNGTIDYREFSECFARVERAKKLAQHVGQILHALISQQQGATTLAAFHALDTNGDGEISSEELRDGLRKMGLGVGKEEMAELMAAMDGNGDGGLDYNEFLATLEQAAATTATATTTASSTIPTAADGDGNGGSNDGSSGSGGDARAAAATASTSSSLSASGSSSGSGGGGGGGGSRQPPAVLHDGVAAAAKAVAMAVERLPTPEPKLQVEEKDDEDQEGGGVRVMQEDATAPAQPKPDAGAEQLFCAQCGDDSGEGSVDTGNGEFYCTSCWRAYEQEEETGMYSTASLYGDDDY